MAAKQSIITSDFPKDLTGCRFGRLAVLRQAASAKDRHSRWECRCDCGSETISRRQDLIRGESRSCGCLRRELTGARFEGPIRGTPKAATRRVLFAHRGLSGLFAAEYKIYCQMLRRCLNPRSKDFHHYGGRGISVCARWRFGENGSSGFECFMDDMGPRPENLTIDRQDNDGNYSPANCRWTSRKVQVANRRKR